MFEFVDKQGKYMAINKFSYRIVILYRDPNPKHGFPIYELNRDGTIRQTQYQEYLPLKNKFADSALLHILAGRSEIFALWHYEMSPKDNFYGIVNLGGYIRSLKPIPDCKLKEALRKLIGMRLHQTERKAKAIANAL